MFWRLVYALSFGEPWSKQHGDTFVDLNRPTLRLLIAESIRRERRERGSMVCWSYSRDRVVERRELRCESPSLKTWRLLAASHDRARAALEHRVA